MPVDCGQVEWPILVLAAVSWWLTVALLFFPPRLGAGRRDEPEGSQPLWARIAAIEVRSLWLLRLAGMIAMTLFVASVLGVYCYLRGRG